MIKCKIHYTDLNVTQYKNLIDHSIHEKYKTYNRFNKELAKKYIKQFGDYFTDESPLFLAFNNKKLNCNNQTFKVEITLQL